MKNYHTTKKGAYMSDREHTAKSPSPRTGFFATLRAPLHGQGTGAPSSRRLRATLAVLALAIAAFAITAAPAAADELKTEMGAITQVSYTSVHLSGKVTSVPGGTGFGSTVYNFEYSTEPANPASWAPGPGGFIEGAAEGKEVFGDLSGLQDGTEYFIRLSAKVGFNGTPNFSTAPNPSFTTLTADPPSVESTDNASEVEYTQVKVSGHVNRPEHSDDLTCNFEYIAEDAYQANPSDDRYSGATTIPCAQSPVATEGSSEVSAKPTGLSPSTTYHLRLAVSNSGSSDSKEAANTFTTTGPIPKPTVLAAGNATDVEYTQAQAAGEVQRPAGKDPALDTECRFEYVTQSQFEAEEFAAAEPNGQIAGCTENPITEASADGAGKQAVTATLPGLAPSTTYHLRLSAFNQEGVDSLDAAATFTTQGPIPAPKVLATKDATGVTIHQATVKGEVQRPDNGKDPGLDVNCRFEYVTQAQFEAGEFAVAEANGQIVGCVENPITEASADGEGKQAVSAQLSGLKAGTTFHLRLVAENGGGTDAKEADNTFTTLPAELPIVTIDPVEGGTFTTAHLSGTLDVVGPPGRLISWYYELSSDGGATWSVFPQNLDISEFPGGHLVVQHDYAGLQPSTTYSFRISSTYSGASHDQAIADGEMAFSPEPNPSITTEPPSAPPTAEGLAVTDVTATTAHFSATVNPNAPAGSLSPVAKNAYRTKWHFECTPVCLDANENVIGGTIQGEEGEQPVFGDTKRLEPGTEYEVRLIVSSEGGGETKTETFNTSKIPPSVKQSLGASDGEGGYTLQGVVNPNKETITACEFKWGPNAPAYAFSAPCSPLPSPGAKPTTVEAHLTGLNADVDYHSLLVVTYGAGLKADSGEDQIFKATLATKEVCPNGQQRAENNSLALPECRAYEVVSPVGKEGFGARLSTYDGGDRVVYASSAGNIAKSGQYLPNNNRYVAERSSASWETIPNLNGSSGSLYDVPFNFERDEAAGFPTAYSSDLLSSVWYLSSKDCYRCEYLRSPDGTFALIGSAKESSIYASPTAVSSDLSHLVTWGSEGISPHPSEWGPGVYEYVGTGNDQPRRVDLDNSGAPISTCGGTAAARSVSADGSRIVLYVYGGCGGANPPADELWARVNATTSIDVSASHCDRIAPAPVCNAPAKPTFIAATPDGSRVFFTTTQQLVDEDVDQTNDIYACDIPAGNPASSAEKANPCAAFRQVSGAQTGAAVESVGPTSQNGATVLFTAKGKLADNEDALKEKAVAGDHNLYVWRTDAGHPDGATAFVGRLDSNDISAGLGQVAQATPDGRYLVFTTASRLLDTDTDTARDVYRYDADTGELVRVSTNVFGVGGNSDAFDARTSPPTENHPTTTVSDDGQKIVFITAEALSPADGNAEPDVYLWTPARVSLITTGSSGYPLKSNVGEILSPSASITGTGQDIYFESAQPLTPADGDDSADVYDARVGGGFSFTSPSICTGEKCQPEPTPVSPNPPSPANAPNGEGNVVPETCPKGKVVKGKKCIKKNKKHHDKKKGKGKTHRASHNRGGSK